MYLNEKLLVKVKALWDKKETLDLNLEKAKTLDNANIDFVKSEANLPNADQQILHKINIDFSLISLKYV
jgi:peptidyl-dipeptidase Dcp